MSRKHTAVFACILALTGVATTGRPNLIFFDDGNDAGWVRSQPRAPFGALEPSNFPGGCRIQATSSPNPALVGSGLLLVADVTTALPDGSADATFDKVPAEAPLSPGARHRGRRASSACSAAPGAGSGPRARVV
jgi:hypothetical protein